MKTKQEYEIRISGSGTPRQIIASLKEIIGNIEFDEGGGALDGATYEDPILIAEINESYENEEVEL